MPLEEFLSLSLIALGIILSLILQFKLRKSQTQLPKAWKNAIPVRNILLSLSFLSLYLLLSFISECVSLYLAKQYIYNSFIFSFYFTLSVPFLFGFLFMHTQTIWKRWMYFILYGILIIYFIQGGYYHPHCVLPYNSSLLIFSIYFLAALLNLSDLLLNPKSTYFNFQLKINLTLLIYALGSVIITSFHWAETMEIGDIYSELIFYIHYSNICLFYLSLSLIFVFEILKLRRR